MAFERFLNYIAGRLVAAESSGWLPVVEPATGQVYGEVAASDANDLQAAVASAAQAAPAWASLTAEQRAAHLHAIAELVQARQEQFVAAESKDTGKPMTLARTVDIPRVAANLRFFAAAMQHFSTECHSTGPELLNYTLRQPLGIVGCISPWNLPLYLFTWKIAPALAAGNCVIGKPSELTPATATLFAQACIDAGLPPGVLNIVHGTGPEVGEAICLHPDIKAVSFTGGTLTGARIASIAAPRFKKLALELGGKNPVLIFDDCDFEAMIAATVRSSFANQGEICLCGSRILIQETLYDRFKEHFIPRVRQLVVGDPMDPATDQGALISAPHRDKVESYLRLAREEGGTILCGGERVRPAGRCADGYFLRPAVIEGLAPTCRTAQEEIFGPVVTLHHFRDEAEAVQLANGTPYGLASVVWTSNLHRAYRVARDLQAGVCWVNCWMVRDLRTPFGGVKQSGVGREGGWEALRFFTEAKNVCVRF